MTKKDALTIALSTLTASTYPNPNFDGKDTTRKEIPVEEIRDTITKMINQLSKPRKSSDEAKAKAKDKRAKARAALIEQVLPILRKCMSNEYRQNFCDGDARKEFGYTAKKLYAEAKDALPADFTAAKVQYILLNEMKDEVIKTEAKGKPNTYQLK